MVNHAHTARLTRVHYHIDDAGCAVYCGISNVMQEMDVLRTDGRANTLEFNEKNYLVCATDKAIRCWRRAAMSFDLLWILEQSLGVHLSSFGSFAWSGNTVMDFDIETASMNGSFSFPAPILNLLVVSDKNSQLFAVARTGKGLCIATTKSHTKSPVITLNQGAKTPFSSLAPLETSAQVTSTNSAKRPVDKKAAIRLLDGPCHALPPISHLAPLFIAQCLAPPLQEQK
ncbi:hypothetical protein DICVIV_11367 [Dictyocaulus viviparus]|uniref:WD domain, G-beta repeat protein n=1 Tax=Dictyocaulus viviparus TaxID=29172 RepID=A0A0D8XJZ1_DICVI|nr:hypothetical protein DICVIV_11367 [Dictyocaulus viviparus]